MNIGQERMAGIGTAEAAAARTVVLASADAGLRERLRQSLTGLRWQVHEAAGGAEAMAQLEDTHPEALLVDSWLPDLEVGEFAGYVRMQAIWPPIGHALKSKKGDDTGMRYNSVSLALSN